MPPAGSYTGSFSSVKSINPVLIHPQISPTSQIYFKRFFVPALTKDSISTLSDRDFFVSFWRRILTSEKFSGAIKYDDVEILGVVMEGEDLAHVVVRNRISVAEHGVESVEVTTFGKIGSQWKVKMSGKLKVIALTLRWEFTH
jgi:hypothetical protein